MNTDTRQQTLEALTHEQIELHIQRARQVRDEAIVDLTKRAIAGLRNAMRRAFDLWTDVLTHKTDTMAGDQPPVRCR